MLLRCMRGFGRTPRGLGGASAEAVASHISTAMSHNDAQSRSRRNARYPAATSSYARQNAGHHSGTPGLAMSWP